MKLVVMHFFGANKPTAVKDVNRNVFFFFLDLTLSVEEELVGLLVQCLQPWEEWSKTNSTHTTGDWLSHRTFLGNHTFSHLSFSWLNAAYKNVKHALCVLIYDLFFYMQW
jgi:hypothetical protein